MHVCVVGAGASGWITAFILNNEPQIKKITIIGSPAIPTIGVGESTTSVFMNFLHTSVFNKTDQNKFLVNIDAATKYGVYYKNWSNKNFLHAFIGTSRNNCEGYLLGSLPINKNENHYMMPLYDQIINDNIFIPNQRLQNYSVHFDANKFIFAMENLAKNESKIHYIKDTVVHANFKADEEVSCLQLSDNSYIKADYYVSCVGQRGFNERVFKEQYEEYSDVLLTNKALFYPLEYKNKEKEFHPYTVAKAMKHGWRWITPTWSRIGTGYVFSENHVSIDEAVHEFQQDIGDNTIEPHVTDFFPRRVKKAFKKNYCSIGMAAGFLEPLDAPGLSLTTSFARNLKDVLFSKINIKDANQESKHFFNFWASFILHQYKTSSKNDTQFWNDHKNVKFDFYKKLIENLYNPVGIQDGIPQYNTKILESPMFYHTSAGKGLRWPVKCDKQPIKFRNNLLKEVDFSKVKTHYQYFKQLHEQYGNLE